MSARGPLNPEKITSEVLAHADDCPARVLLRDVMSRVITENERRELIFKTLASSCTITGGSILLPSSMNRFRGPAGYFNLIEALRNSIPNAAVTINHEAAWKEGEARYDFTEFTLCGTFTSALYGLAPTNDAVRFNCAALAKIGADNRVHHLEIYSDTPSALRNMGKDLFPQLSLAVSYVPSASGIMGLIAQGRQMLMRNLLEVVGLEPGSASGSGVSSAGSFDKEAVRARLLAPVPPTDAVGLLRKLERDIYSPFLDEKDRQTIAHACLDQSANLEGASLTGVPLMGPNGYLSLVHMWMAALPDINHVVHHEHAWLEGEVTYVCQRWSKRGTFTGVASFLPATANANSASVVWEGVSIARVKHGKITHLDCYMDWPALAAQMSWDTFWSAVGHDASAAYRHVMGSGSTTGGQAAGQVSSASSGGGGVSGLVGRVKDFGKEMLGGGKSKESTGGGGVGMQAGIEQ